MTHSKLNFLRDIRIGMLVIMLSLLLTGVWIKDFSIHSAQILLTFASGLATQALWCCRARIPLSSLLSAAVTCTGLALLLRSDSLWVHPLVAALAISSKFLIQWHGKHIFNPANLGVIVALIFLPGAWSSPGLWGHEIIWAAWLVAVGSFLARNARRIDISWAFLAVYLGLIETRVAWLGQRPAVWFHQFDNGALLLFAFFMISDPRTSPNHRAARCLHAVLVAVFAFYWQFGLWRQNSLLWALFFSAPLVPVWDLIWPDEPFQWRNAAFWRPQVQL